MVIKRLPNINQAMLHITYMTVNSMSNKDAIYGKPPEESCRKMNPWAWGSLPEASQWGVWAWYDGLEGRDHAGRLSLEASGGPLMWHTWGWVAFPGTKISAAIFHYCYNNISLRGLHWDTQSRRAKIKGHEYLMTQITHLTHTSAIVNTMLILREECSVVSSIFPRAGMMRLACSSCCKNILPSVTTASACSKKRQSEQFSLVIIVDIYNIQTRLWLYYIR